MVKHVADMKELQQRVAELEKLEKEQLQDLKQAAVTMVESITPAHLLKTTLRDISTSPGVRSSLLDTVIGIGAGFLGKKIFVGRSHNIFKKIAGPAVQFLLSNFVSKKLYQGREKSIDAKANGSFS